MVCSPQAATIMDTFLILRNNSSSVQDSVYTMLVVHQSGKASFRSRVTVANWNPGEYGVARVVKQRIRRHTGRDKSKVPYSVEHDSVNVDLTCGQVFHYGVPPREAGYRSLSTIETLMKTKEIIKRASEFAKPFRISKGTDFRLKDVDPDRSEERRVGKEYRSLW